MGRRPVPFAIRPIERGPPCPRRTNGDFCGVPRDLATAHAADPPTGFLPGRKTMPRPHE
ncbi:MAG TPA: hypothetical protein VGL05_16590 [Kribbella sp.]